MRWTPHFAALCLVLLAAGQVAAQDATLGTTNLDSPSALLDGDVRIELDYRYWEGGNGTVSAAVEYGISDQLDVGVTYTHFDNAGLPTIAGALRGSELSGPGINLKWVGREVEPGSFGWAIVPGVEFLDMSGTNLPAGATAGGDETIFTLEAPIGIPDGDVLWIIDPKLATFPESQAVRGPAGLGLPPRIAHFDTVIGIGLGIVAPLGGTGDWWIHGDMTPIVSGGNSIDDVTNRVSVAVPWSVGVRWQNDLITEDTFVDLYVTTASGPTTATSLIAAPDKTVSVGGAVSVEF